MNLIKRILIILIVIVVFLFLVRSYIYRTTVSYKNTGIRKGYVVRDSALINYIESTTQNFTPRSINDIIEKSLEITSDKLTYTATKNDNDPNKLVKSQKAHCVGYSAFFSSVCNYLLQKYDFEDWQSVSLVGKIHFLGIDAHRYFSSPFFRDHDFNLIDNVKSGEKYFVDPTLFDYSGITYVRSN